jgi:nucleoid DNA-binding protein
MTKADLIEGLSNWLGLVKIDAERVIDIVLDDIINALKEGARVNISGFGHLCGEAPTGRNRKRGVDQDFGEPIGEVQGWKADEGIA